MMGRLRRMSVVQTWVEGDTELTRTVDINSTSDIRKVKKMLRDVGVEITYFVTNPRTPLYCICELGKDRRILKETRVIGKSFVLEQDKDEWRELLNPNLTGFLDLVLGKVDVVSEKIVEKTIRALSCHGGEL